MVDADLRSMGRHYYALRGWLMVPTGALFIAAGLTNMPPIGDEPVNRAGLFALAVVAVAAGVAYYLVDRHYRTTFGRIDPASSTKVRVTAYTVVAAIVICAGITVDSQADLPICLYGTAYAATLLAYYQLLVGLRPYHWACLGSLGVLSLMPVWGSVDDKVSLVLLPIGVATIAVGLFDHQELVRSIRTVRSGAVPADARA